MQSQLLLSETLDVVPVAKPRPKFRQVKKKGQKFATTMVYYQNDYLKWEEELASMLRPMVVRKHSGPVKLEATFAFPVPPSLSKKEKAERLEVGWHAQKPDSDNLAKSVLDSMNHIGIWDDDSQVCDIHCQKRWSERGYIAITVTAL